MAREFTKAFYRSKEWQRVRDYILKRDMYLIDEKVSNQIADYKAKNPGLSKATFDWKKKPNEKGSSLIKAMQKWAKMSAKEQDGEIGPNTIKAFQKKLGTTVDGYVSKPFFYG